MLQIKIISYRTKSLVAVKILKASCICSLREAKEAVDNYSSLPFNDKNTDYFNGIHLTPFRTIELLGIEGVEAEIIN